MQDTIVIRHSTDQDRAAIASLAALDSRAAPAPGDALLALVDGQLRAALTLGDGDLLADPFKPTAELAALLRLRAAQEQRDIATRASMNGHRRPVRLWSLFSRRPSVARA